MKNIKYIIGLFFTIALFVSCEEESYEFGDLIAPSNINISYTIVGVDTNNPNGDGSGEVDFTVTSDNALAHKFFYKGSDSNAPEGTKTYGFVSEDGPIGTFSLSKHVVTAVAYGTGGASTSTSIEVEVLTPNVPPPVIFEDFEGPVLPEIGTFGPDGHYIAIIENPDKSGINESDSVVEYIKPNASQDWAGLYFSNDGIDMDKYGKVSLKVRASKTCKMLFKLENVDNSTSWEMEGDIVGNDTWQEIVFDFADAPEADYTKVVLFFDIWNIGDDSTYYFDDIKLLN